MRKPFQRVSWLLVVLMSLNLYGVTNGFCSPHIGQDYLGLQQPHFDETLIPPTPLQGTAIGVLDFTFGTATAPISSVLSSLHPTFLRFHLIDGTCIRAGTCGSYCPWRDLSKSNFDRAILQGNQAIKSHVKQRTLLYKNLSASFPNTKFLGSPVLEHDLSPAAYRTIANWMLEAWPGLQLVNCSDTGIFQEKYKGALLEQHGDHAPTNMDIVSTDGIDATDINLPALVQRHKTARIFFLWTRSYNLRDNQKAFIDPRQRTKGPTAATFEMLAHILDNVPLVKFTGNGCSGNSPFQSPNIWKPLAEDTGNNDPRSNFPVLISKFGAGTVEVVASNGNKIGQLGYFGGFQEGLNRHYSKYGSGTGQAGYTFEKQAQSASGSRWTWLKQGKQCLGPILTGRRQGSYR